MISGNNPELAHLHERHEEARWELRRRLRVNNVTVVNILLGITIQ